MNKHDEISNFTSPRRGRRREGRIGRCWYYKWETYDDLALEACNGEGERKRGEGGTKRERERVNIESKFLFNM